MGGRLASPGPNRSPSTNSRFGSPGPNGRLSSPGPTGDARLLEGPDLPTASPAAKTHETETAVAAVATEASVSASVDVKEEGGNVGEEPKEECKEEPEEEPKEESEEEPKEEY